MKNNTEWFDGIHAVKMLNDMAFSEKKEAMLSANNVSIGALHKAIRFHYFVFVVDGALLVAKRRDDCLTDKEKGIRLPNIKVITRPDQLISLFFEDIFWENHESRIDLLSKIPSRQLQFLLDALTMDPNSIRYTHHTKIKW